MCFYADSINHPAHYEKAAVTLQPLHFCERLKFNLGNALKYAFRYSYKGRPAEDLSKCIFYINESQTDREPRYSKREMLYFNILLPFLCLAPSRPVANAAKDAAKLDSNMPEVQFKCFFIALRKEAQKALDEMHYFVLKRDDSKEEKADSTGSTPADTDANTGAETGGKKEGNTSVTPEQFKAFMNISDAFLGTVKDTANKKE
jgi:hypothetical protein